MKLEHCQPIAEWWNNRQELQDAEGNDKAKCFTAEELIALNCNFDQCKFPKTEEEILPPAELLKNYYAKRRELDLEIDRTLSEIQKILGIDLTLE